MTNDLLSNTELDWRTKAEQLNFKKIQFLNHMPIRNYLENSLEISLLKSIDTKRGINSLKMFRDFFERFDLILDDLSKFKRKYNMELKDGIALLGSSEALPTLIKDLTPEQLGYLMIVVNDISVMNDDFKDFVNYDTAQLQTFHKKLRRVLTNLNRIVK